MRACVCLFSILRYLTLWHNIQIDPPAVRTGWGWNLISMCVLFVFCINHSFLCHLVYIKVKVFPYLLPSVGPGADPGVQAVSPQVTWSESRHIPSSSLPLLSARPAFYLRSSHQMARAQCAHWLRRPCHPRYILAHLKARSYHTSWTELGRTQASSSDTDVRVTIVFLHFTENV